MATSITKSKNSLEQIADKTSLYKAWQTVKQSAGSSKSQEISNQASNFNNNIIENIEKISEDLLNNTYAFQKQTAAPQRRKGKSARPIVIAAIEDRIVQRSILNFLSSQETIAGLIKNPFSFGGIENRGVKEAIVEIRSSLNSGFNYFIKSDIKNFFQDIHTRTVNEKIIKNLPDTFAKQLIYGAIKCELKNMESSHVDRHLYPKDDIGVMQGCCLSPMYGNLYLSEFDKQMNGLTNIKCFRYIDDFVILGNRERVVRKAYAAAETILMQLGLKIYKLDQGNTKAVYGVWGKNQLDILGCTILPGRLQPYFESKNRLLKKIDDELSTSLKIMESTKGLSRINENYVKTINNINQILYGWIGAYKFCDDVSFFNGFYEKIYGKIEKYNSRYYDLKKSMNGDKYAYLRLLGIPILMDDPRFGQKNVSSNI